MGCATSVQQATLESSRSNEEDNPKVHTQNSAMVYIGSLRLQPPTMKILFVFGKNDSQGIAFAMAAETGGYASRTVTNHEDALDSLKRDQPNVIFIDARASSGIDGERLCRSVRANKKNEQSIIVAVTNALGPDQIEPSVLPLLSAGFNRRFRENLVVSVCLNELLLLEYGELRSQIRMSAAQSLLKAVEISSDAIEITNDNYIIEYVNPTHEKLFGYANEELIGKDTWEVFKSDKNQADLRDVCCAHLRKGKTFETTRYSRHKLGGHVRSSCKMIPVVSPSGAKHHISIMNPTVEPSHVQNEYNPMVNGVVHSSANLQKRKESTLHSLSVEAPINKVMNILNRVQANSSPQVASELDKVVEILHRTTELYTPNNLSQQVKDDQMTSDLVLGLMTPGSESESLHLRHASRAVLKPVTAKMLTEASGKITAILEDEPNWEFDVVRLEQVTEKRPLVYLGMKTFQRFGVLAYLQVSETELVNWLQVIEANYRPTNSYHNSTHAADVLHASAYFLELKKLKDILDQDDQVATVIAAVIHDLDHPGRTSPFLINMRDPLAILYNDLSVLEMHHAASAFQLTNRDPNINIFKNLDRQDFRGLRQQIIDMVLATDMSRHFELVAKFASGVNNPTNLTAEEGIDDVTEDSKDLLSYLKKADNKGLIKRILIKCADISNPMRPLELCIEWANRIANEYFEQTDEEKSRSLPVVMQGFDKQTCNVPRSQNTFIKLFIKDLYNEWHAFCDIPDLMEHLNSNCLYWKEQEDVVANAMANR